jgi:cysteine/histidine-rich domain-containing protein
MLPSKVEIKLKKAEPGSWSKLDIPRETKSETSESKENAAISNTQIDAVDLSDL